MWGPNFYVNKCLPQMYMLRICVVLSFLLGLVKTPCRASTVVSLLLLVLKGDVWNVCVGRLNDVEVKVTNFQNEDKGLATIAGDVFDVPIRPDIVHRVVRWQLAKRRQVWDRLIE